MNTRTSILVAAAELLAASPVSDVSTRAVCEAAGVGAPTLYRHFGDKEGLLSAVVDYGFERYLAGKRAAKASTDPVRDLRDGWESHVAFAVRNPAFYRLMHSPAVTTPPEAAAEALRLLTDVLDRCAAAGRLRVPPPVAAQMVMSANVGFALMLLTQPGSFDPATSTRVRDAIHAAILTDAPATGNGTAAAATRLAALLPESTSDALSPAETALLREWLTRLT
ncbi:TetR/AcrR family transcriptional regulator [Amycolatopsis sp. YIM 10]|uniref:TetR/AcrR family transcriptional regulator n=1 Tax=Amycolatopsis sp. YIM 10 TaxID=2653857 RepID=UPI00128FCF5B|nr:TetR/AcrR family transcriptional regulator [Amycolatopsis sp. YIM 10]